MFFPGTLITFISEHEQFQFAQVTTRTWAFSLAGKDGGAPLALPAPVSDSARQDRGVPLDVRAPVSDSAGQDRSVPPDVHVPVSGCDFGREVIPHQCEHVKKLKRSARPLDPGHALAEFDSSTEAASEYPFCCRPLPREEWYDRHMIQEEVFYLTASCG